jgi:DNA modification methylase
MMQLLHGDCREAMATLPENSVDAIVCDPPYLLNFMGKDFDSQGGAHADPKQMQSWHESWAREAYRVLKPGGHLLAFGGSRTYHRLACAVEDAGFEIRDQLQYLYGSGFPKSLNVAKAIQGAASQAFRTDVLRLTSTTADLLCHCSDSCRRCGVPLHWSTVPGQASAPPQGDALGHSRLSAPSPDTRRGSGHRCTASWVGLSDHLSTLGYPHHKDADAWQPLLAVASFLCPACFVESMMVASVREVPPTGIDWSSIDASSVVAWATSETLLRSYNMWSEPYNQYITALARFDGFGSALKPAHEPIVLARKPLIGTVAANVTAHGTGALNIDKTRIPSGPDHAAKCASVVGLQSNRNGNAYGEWTGERTDSHSPLGRWPANVILSHSPECREVGVKRVKGHKGYPNGPKGSRYDVGEAPNGRHHAEPWPGHADPDGYETVTAWECAPDCAVALLDAQSGERRSAGNYPTTYSNTKGYGGNIGKVQGALYSDSGGPSRFFYTAKASRAERNAGLDGMPERVTSIGDERPSGGMHERFGNENGSGRSATSQNHHPCVKPIALMRWLCRLITPPGGTVLDPFAGSGSTGIAAVLEGFDFIGIEQDSEYLTIAEARIDHWTREAKKATSPVRSSTWRQTDDHSRHRHLHRRRRQRHCGL